MLLNRFAAVLEVEVLEDRAAPAVISPTPAAPLPTVSGLAIVPLNSAAAQTGAGLTAAGKLGLTANGALATPLSPVTTINPFASATSEGGALPLNNSIPNAAQILANGAGLNALSPFLPTYYIGYTQVGPFYTGSDSPTSPPVSESYFQANTSNSTANDAFFSQPTDVSTLLEAAHARMS